MITVAIYFRSFHGYPRAGCFNDQLCPTFCNSFDSITSTSPLIIQHNRILDRCCLLCCFSNNSIGNREMDVVNFTVMQQSENFEKIVKHVMKKDKWKRKLIF